MASRSSVVALGSSSPPTAAERLDLLALANALGRQGSFAAGVIWCSAFAATMLLLWSGQHESIPYHVYAAAGARWLAHDALYETRTIDGFQYLPQSALLFTPFAWLGEPLGAIAWRALSWSAYALGIWRVGRRLAPSQSAECFLIATCLAVAPAIGSLGNGQANLMLGALSLHAIGDLIGRRWWRASAIVVIGLALKPLLIVLLLLVLCLFQPLSWRIPLLLLGMLATPWLTGDPAWALQQYIDCWTKLGMCATPDRLFEDTRGLLAALGWTMPHSIYFIVRIATAILISLICLYVRRRSREPYASFFIGAFASSYLMLFNPRTMSTSYVMIGSFAALLASRCLLQRRWACAFALGLVSSAWTINYQMIGFVQFWLKPLACLCFVAILLATVRSVRSSAARASS